MTTWYDSAIFRMSSRNLLTFHSPENYCILKHLKCHGRLKWYLQGNRKGLNLFSNNDQQFYSGLWNSSTSTLCDTSEVPRNFRRWSAQCWGNNWNATTYYQSINKFNTWFIELWFCFIEDVFILVFQRPQLKNGNDDRQAAINCTYQVIIWHHVSEILISNNTLDNYIQATLSGGFRSFWFVCRALNSIMRF